MFYCIDRPPLFMDAEGTKIIGMVFPLNMEEAKSIFSILPAYMRRIARDAVERWFTESALAKAAEIYFDDEKIPLLLLMI